MSDPIIDIGILTIREDEFKAVLKCFPDDPDILKTRHREYALRTTDAGGGKRYRLAVVRQLEQGNGEAQEAARDLIDDVSPSLVLVVGIAGGLPSDDISLGDVVISTRILDFSLEARKFQDATTYNTGGGPIPKAIAASVANLGAREEELGEWWSDLPAKPAVAVSRSNLYYGPKTWRARVQESIEAHFGRRVTRRPPCYIAGVVASSDRLIKDPELLIPWITTNRAILAVEMESAGVHRATRDNTPMLAIRSLSDIVGLKRQDAWTKYACRAAAAFARAYLITQPVQVRERISPPATHSNRTRAKAAKLSKTEAQPPIQEAFANLIPLRQFPQTLYVAPALCKSAKQGWMLLRRGLKATSHEYVPAAWSLYERNVYSFADPEHCRLRRIMDVGGLEPFDSSSWAYSPDENKRRMFVYLLNSALKDDLWGHGVRHHMDQDVYAFMGHPKDEPRKFRYGNVKVRSTVTVVQHYRTKPKTGKGYQYLRHAGFQGRFRLLGQRWYLEITPTYRFTFDGKQLDRFHEDRLSGIKRLERNRSVLSQLLVWQALLRAPWTHADRPRLLEFAPLLSFEFQPTTDERDFTALDAPTVPIPDDEEISE